MNPRCYLWAPDEPVYFSPQASSSKKGAFRMKGGFSDERGLFGWEGGFPEERGAFRIKFHPFLPSEGGKRMKSGQKRMKLGQKRMKLENLDFIRKAPLPSEKPPFIRKAPFLDEQASDQPGEPHGRL